MFNRLSASLHSIIIFMGAGAFLCFRYLYLAWYEAHSKHSINVWWMNEKSCVGSGWPAVLLLGTMTLFHQDLAFCSVCCGCRSESETSFWVVSRQGKRREGQTLLPLQGQGDWFLLVWPGQAIGGLGLAWFILYCYYFYYYFNLWS